MTRRLFAICVMAILVILATPALTRAADVCWYEPGDPPIEHCDPPPCGEETFDVRVADYSDGSSITRIITRCSISHELLSCDRRVTCVIMSPCAAGLDTETLACPSE